MESSSCSQCGVPVPDTAKFCPGCGQPISISVVSEVGDGTAVEVDGSAPVDSPKPPRTKNWKRPGSKTVMVVVCAVVILVIASGAAWANRLTDAEESNVQKTFTAIASIGEVTQGTDPAKIESARGSYDRLSSKEQRHVRNRKDLERAEDALFKLEVAHAIKLIELIGKVDPSSGQDIRYARTAYDALDEPEQKAVTNIGLLVKAEKLYSQKATANAISLIDSIGKVSLSSGPAIEAAESAYSALGQDDQKLITNHAELVSAGRAWDEMYAKNQSAKRQAELRSTIRMTEIRKSKPNSAGGVSLYIGFKNMSMKTIKYATFSVTPYDRVGEIVFDEIKGQDCTVYARAEGPYKKGQGMSASGGTYWDCAWYSWSINKLKLDEIEIEYMDGSTETIAGNEVKYVRY